MIGSKELFMLERESELNDLQGYNKAFIKEKAAEVINIALEGEVNPLKIKIACKTAIEYFSQIDAGIKDAALTEAAKFGKSTELLNAKIEVRNTATTYDYSNDPVWVELKNKIKEREKLMVQALKTKGILFDEEGIEVPKAIEKGGVESVFISIK